MDIRVLAMVPEREADAGLNDPEGEQRYPVLKTARCWNVVCYEFRTKFSPRLQRKEILPLSSVGIPEPEFDTTQSGDTGWNPNPLRDSNHPHQPRPARSFFRALQSYSG